MKKYLLLLGIISMLLISCSEQPKEVQPTLQPKAVVGPADEPSEPIQAEMPVPGQEDEVEETIVIPDSKIKEFDITAKKFEFIPSTITVNQGDKVRLNIKSVDVTHGFAISEFGISENLRPGKTVTVEFTADKKGEYTFFCSVYCGGGHSGMRGKLIVE